MSRDLFLVVQSARCRRLLTLKSTQTNYEKDLETLLEVISEVFE